MTNETITALKKLLGNSRLKEITYFYLENQEVRKMALQAISALICETPEKPAILPSKENAQKITNAQLENFKAAFNDRSTGVLHTATIKAINAAFFSLEEHAEVMTLKELKKAIELSFAQIQQIFETPNFIHSNPATVQDILKHSSVLVTSKNRDSNFFTYCKEYLLLLITVLRTIDELRKLNLVIQDLHEPGLSAQTYIKELYGRYKQHSDSLSTTLSQIKASAQDPDSDKEKIKKQLDELEAKIKPENSFEKQCLSQMTPENTPLTLLFLDFIREAMKAFDTNLLEELSTTRRVINLPKLFTTIFSASSLSDQSTNSSTDSASMFFSPRQTS